MKTFRSTTHLARMLAGLAVLTAAGFAQAEEAGVVRISDFGDETNLEAVDTSVEVIRGQSQLRRRNAQTSQALRRLFQGSKPQRTSTPAAQTTPPAEPVNTTAPSAEANVQTEAVGIQPAGLFTASTDQCSPCDGDACCPSSACDAACDCCSTTCDPASGCCDSQGCCLNGCDGCRDGCGNGCGTGCGSGNGHGLGSRLFGRHGDTNACPQCGGKGCSSCKGRKGKLLGGHGWGRKNCNSSSCGRGHGFGGLFHSHAANYRARNHMASAQLNAYLRCKCGYFVPDGCGGVGSPLFGHYNIVYPVNSGYSDGRDSQVYAAAGYGGPVSVPLAPTVRQAYNYGWGIPSSRLTPVSNRPVQ